MVIGHFFTSFVLNYPTQRYRAKPILYQPTPGYPSTPHRYPPKPTPQQPTWKQLAKNTLKCLERPKPNLAQLSPEKPTTTSYPSSGQPSTPQTHPNVPSAAGCGSTTVYKALWSPSKATLSPGSSRTSSMDSSSNDSCCKLSVLKWATYRIRRRRAGRLCGAKERRGASSATWTTCRSSVLAPCRVNGDLAPSIAHGSTNWAARAMP